MKCIVVTPEKTEVDREASFVVVPLYDGEYGIGHGHTPVVGRIGAGELRITTPEGENIPLYIEGGFMEVAHETVSILTSRALTKEKVTLQGAKEVFQAARAKPQSTPELTAIKEKAVAAARRQMAVAEKWGK